MGLFEWLGESLNPGPVGDIGIHENNRSGKTRLSAILLGILAQCAALTPIVLFCVYRQHDPGFLGNLVGVSILECMYIIAGYFLKPEPDTTNLGWAGGVFDDPFRISDDFNRFLIFLLIFLIPGRLIGIGLVDFARVFRKTRNLG